MLIFAIFIMLLGSAVEPVLAAEAATHAEQAKEYYCPMHPQIVRDAPGQCPICFMSLVLRTGHRSEPKASDVQGHATISVDPDAVRLLGVRAEEVTRRPLHKILSLPGSVVHDQELFDAQVEHIKTLTSQTQTEKELYKSIGPRWFSLGPKPKEFTRIKLMRLGMDEESIDQLTPTSQPDFRLLHLKDMSDEAWVYAYALPGDASLIRKGDAVEIESSVMPGVIIKGTVEGVAPFAQMETKTVRIRILAREKGQHLIPETPVSVAIHAELGEKLSVPETAVLFSGSGEFVFVHSANNEYKPVAVRTGRKAEGYYEVLEGLAGGESVAVGGTFFLDSESRLQTAFLSHAHSAGDGS